MKSLSKNITIIVTVTVIATLCACANAKAKDTDKNNVTISAQSNETVPTRTLPKGAVAFDYTNHLYFDVVLRDSIPARMVFDTGNTSILLDEAFYKKHFAHLGNLRKAMAAGAGNAMQAVNLDMSGWKYSVGEHNQTEQEAVVMDLRKILGDGVDGMFGMAFMRGRKVEFNYTDEYMRILPQEEQPSAEYTCIKCKWLDASQTRMLIPIKVKITDEVSFDGNFLVDMGASTGMLLNSNLATKLNLKSVLPNTKKIIYDVAGVGGSATNYIFRAKGVAIAGSEISDIRTSYSTNTQGPLADSRYDGLIGNGLLERFDMIFDFVKCEIWLRPNKNINKVAIHHSGIVLTPKNDCWIVNGLIEGGNAEKAGLKRGDVVTSINGLSRDKVDLKTLIKMSESAEAWKITVKRGNTSSEITFEKEKL